MDDRDIRWQAVERTYREHADDGQIVAIAGQLGSQGYLLPSAVAR